MAPCRFCCRGCGQGSRPVKRGRVSSAAPQSSLTIDGRDASMPQTTLWRIRYEPTATRIFSSKQRVFAAPHRKQHNAASVSTVCARAMPRGGAVPGFRAGWYRGRQQPGDALQEPRGRNRIELLSPAGSRRVNTRCAKALRDTVSQSRCHALFFTTN